MRELTGAAQGALAKQAPRLDAGNIGDAPMSFDQAHHLFAADD